MTAVLSVFQQFIGMLNKLKSIFFARLGCTFVKATTCSKRCVFHVFDHRPGHCMSEYNNGMATSDSSGDRTFTTRIYRMFETNVLLRGMEWHSIDDCQFSVNVEDGGTVSNQITSSRTENGFNGLFLSGCWCRPFNGNLILRSVWQLDRNVGSITTVFLRWL